MKYQILKTVNSVPEFGKEIPEVYKTFDSEYDAQIELAKLKIRANVVTKSNINSFTCTDDHDNWTEYKIVPEPLPNKSKNIIGEQKNLFCY
jgi:hypothetical protein